jgi:amidohydrolase|tara:strand:+ start:552 stop:1889 length:1338 start_codon:yes stop_codon:yes gene_type:complete
MMIHQDLKELAWNEIDRKSDYLINISKRILNIPETGFMEYKTSKYVSEKLSELNIPHRKGIALTGIKGYLEGIKPGPTIAIIGELDSVRVEGHAYADPSTSAAHACGHHCQIGMMIGVAVGLKASGILENLSGRIAFMALPAEEFIDVEYRYGLYKSNQIEFMSGKQEFLRLGEFSDIDMAMMTHTSHLGNTKFLLGGTTNGHFVKFIRFLGKAAHAGGAPHNGVNALQAAILALNALNTQRETFQSEDTVRLHGIMTSGGVSVSSIPSEVKYEGRVRGASIDAIENANEKMDRCLRAGALAIGAKVEIVTIPGYLPLINNQELSGLFSSNASTIVGTNAVRINGDNVNRGGSTDLGDLSHIMPVIHPYTGCATGSGHGIDYIIQDYIQGVINPAKAMAATVIDLLSNHSQRASGIIDKFVPRLCTEDYVSSQRARFREELYEGK